MKIKNLNNLMIVTLFTQRIYKDEKEKALKGSYF